MKKSILAGAAIATCGAVVLASCAASATMSSYMKGTWDCTSSGAQDSATVEVGDGTFTLSAQGEALTGTWDTAFGDLTVKVAQGPHTYVTGGVLKNFPGKDAPQGFTSPWTPSFSSDSAEAAPLAVSVDGKKVRLVYTSTDGTDTTTTCAKR